MTTPEPVRFLKPTRELGLAFDLAMTDVCLEEAETDRGLAAVLPIAEAELRAHIAFRIRAELVCCDVYERDHGTVRAGREHSICFWGEAAARIAEDADGYHARLAAEGVGR